MNERPSTPLRLLCASMGAVLLSFAHWACTSVPSPEAPKVPDQAFAKLSDSFIQDYLQIFPVMASSLGDHRRDGEWGDYSKAGEAQVVAFYQKYRASLQSIDPAQLNADNQVDAAVLSNEIESRLFEIEKVPPLRLSPMAYIEIISLGLDTLATHAYGTPEGRAQALTKRMQNVSQIVAAAKERLENPSKLDTETAIVQAQGLIELCESGIKPLLKAAPVAAPALSAAAAQAKVAIEDLKQHLQTVVLPRSQRDFRLGKELYARKMQFALVDTIEPEQLAEQAHKALARTLGAMYEVARELSPELLKKTPKPTQDLKQQRQLVRAVLNKMALEQPTDATLFTEAEAAIESASAFIRQKRILTIPDEKCQVIRMPAFNAGFAGAYSLSSGPFDTKFENFVAIEPPPPAEKVSFYREYNKSMLIELMLHEAVPGHCLQAMHAVKSRHPLRAIFGNGPYAEGWAMYSEEVMAKHGFGGARIHMVQLKLLARAISNTLLDYEVHTRNMSEAKAMELMMEQTFQEKAEAVGKWRRVRLSAVQLTTYFYGYQQFAAMREAAEMKPDFNEMAFHDQLLGSGAPPLKLLRARYGL